MKYKITIEISNEYEYRLNNNGLMEYIEPMKYIYQFHAENMNEEMIKDKLYDAFLLAKDKQNNGA